MVLEGAAAAGAFMARKSASSLGGAFEFGGAEDTRKRRGVRCLARRSVVGRARGRGVCILLSVRGFFTEQPNVTHCGVGCLTRGAEVEVERPFFCRD